MQEYPTGTGTPICATYVRATYTTLHVKIFDGVVTNLLTYLVVILQFICWLYHSVLYCASDNVLVVVF